MNDFQKLIERKVESVRKYKEVTDKKSYDYYSDNYYSTLGYDNLNRKEKLENNLLFAKYDTWSPFVCILTSWELLAYNKRKALLILPLLPFLPVYLGKTMKERLVIKTVQIFGGLGIALLLTFDKNTVYGN